MARICLVAALILVPASVAAQSFSPLASRLKVGQKVYVVVDAPCTADGCGGEFVEGKVSRLTPTSIAVESEGHRFDLEASQVRRVERYGDRVWNGVGYGVVFGFLTGYIYASSDCGPRQDWCFFDSSGLDVMFGIITAGMGAGIGAITDA